MSSFKNELLNGSSNSIKSLKLTQTVPTRVIQVPSVESLEVGKRGIVLFPPCKISDNREEFVYEGKGMDPVYLRKSVLFWDKLEVPTNNMFQIDFNAAELEYLESCGIVQRTRVNMSGSYSPGEIIINSHKKVFEALDKANPRAWSTASQNDSVIFTPDEMDESLGVGVNLYGALQIPDGEVPLENILEFKEKRRDELLALRHHLDDVYQKIISSPDKALAELSEIEKIDRAISDYLRAISEQKFSLTKTSLQANFSFNKATTASIGATAIGLPLTGALLAGAVAGIDIKLGKGLKGGRDNSTPFQYIHSLHSKL